MKTPLTPDRATFQLLHLKNVPILQQLQMEEALLRADDRNWCLVNTGAAPAIVMGISGKPELLIEAQKLKQQPIPVIRRFSGGGTVVIDPQTVFITWIASAQVLAVPCYPASIHAWCEAFYQSAWPQLAMRLKENDYVIGEHKFGGNAQYLRHGRWLHHSSLLWDYDPEKMNYLKMPLKLPDYRQQRSHLDFLCRLRTYFPQLEHFKAQFFSTLEKKFSVQESHLEAVHRVQMKTHRKSTEVIILPEI